jgi:hypothetical protein
MFEIHSQTIARLQRQVTELQEQFGDAVKQRDYWEYECQVARKERDKATQVVKYDGDTLSCETIIKHMTDGSLEINSRFISGGGE